MHVIYLRGEDDLATIQHMLEGAQDGRVLLVVPRTNQALRNGLAMRLLRRFVAARALDLALVTQDGRIQEEARAEGLATVPSVTIGKWGLWRSHPPGRSAAQRAAAVRVAGLRLGRGDIGYSGKPSLWAGRVLGILLFALLLLVVGALAILVVPEARITVIPYRQTVDTTFELRADPQAQGPNLTKLEIPARLVEVEVELKGEAATTSTRDAPDAAAGGTVTFISQTAGPREILPGVIVRTSTGTTVRFRTVSTATLSANIGATAQAQVEALEPGPVGNVPAATINTVETPELRGKVRVINENPTTGGGVKQVGVVTRVDMDRLKAQVFEQLQQRAYEELQGKLSEQEFLPKESLTFEILSEVYDQFLDAQADVLHLTMRIYATGTSVDRAKARLFACDALKQQLVSNRAVNCDDISFSLSSQVRMEGRVVLVDAASSVTLVSDVDRGAVRSAAAGHTVEEAVRVLTDSFTLDGPPAVEVSPQWIKRWRWLYRVPYLPLRIQVVVVK